MSDPKQGRPVIPVTVSALILIILAACTGMPSPDEVMDDPVDFIEQTIASPAPAASPLSDDYLHRNASALDFTYTILSLPEPPWPAQGVPRLSPPAGAESHSEIDPILHKPHPPEPESPYRIPRPPGGPLLKVNQLPAVVPAPPAPTPVVTPVVPVEQSVPDGPLVSQPSDSPTPSTPATPAPIRSPQSAETQRESVDQPQIAAATLSTPMEIATPTPVRAEQTVRPGARFFVSLAGSGWIYLDSSGPIDFIGRERRGQSTVFTFRQRLESAPEPVELVFELQDLTSGRRLRHEEVILLPDTFTAPGAPARVAESQERQPGSASALPGRQGLEPAPSVQATLEERLRNAAERDGPLATEEMDLLSELLNETGDPISHPRETLAFTERLLTAGEGERALPVLEALLNAGGPRYDYLLFTLASLYELPGPERNIQRSRTLYRQLLQQYPLSDYWERSRERIEYLERHFFFIR